MLEYHVLYCNTSKYVSIKSKDEGSTCDLEKCFSRSHVALRPRERSSRGVARTENVGSINENF